MLVVLPLPSHMPPGVMEPISAVEPCSGKVGLTISCVPSPPVMMIEYVKEKQPPSELRHTRASQLLDGQKNGSEQASVNTKGELQPGQLLATHCASGLDALGTEGTESAAAQGIREPSGFHSILHPVRQRPR